MPGSAQKSLFYSPALPAHDLALLVAGAVVAAPVGDVIAFAEGGGSAQRALAIPLLPDMDRVVVSDAHLRVRAGEREMPVTAPTISKTSGDNVGVTVRLAAPSRIRRVVLRATFAAGVVNLPVRHSMPGLSFSTRASAPGVTEKADLRVVVRPVVADGSFGPPIFIEPAFTPPKLYQPVQAGLSLAVVEQGALQIVFPSTAGTAWLIQLVAAESATALNPLAFDGDVTRVAIGAVPENVEIVALGAASGDPPISIWSNPNPLPAAGIQDVIFTPAAQRLLSQRLEASTGTEPTLPVSLSFVSTAGGDLEIVSSALSAHYQVEPFGTEPLDVALSGAWTPVTLSAPRGVRPASGTATLTARYLGAELNAGSPLPPLASPGAGVRVSPARWAATALAVAPLEPRDETVAVPIVSSHVYCQAVEPSEVVVELREDVAGSPGARAGDPVVVPLAPGPAGWVSFDLPAPLLRRSGISLWVAVRATRGTVLWFGCPAQDMAGPALVSVDEGGAWGALDPLLGPSNVLLAQLFHARDPAPTLDIAVNLGQTVVAEVPLVRISPPADPASPLPHRGEYAGDLPLPAVVLTALAAAPPGSGRGETRLRLFSRSVADLVVSDATLSYDPFG